MVSLTDMIMKKFTIWVLAVLLLCLAPSAHAAGKLVAAVLTSDINRYKEAYRSFVKTLAAKGFNQDTIEIVTQTPNPDPISWANSVRKFKAIVPDVLVTFGAPVTIAAMREVNDIPIVFVDVYGPVETGVSRSMSKSGGNLSGISSKVPMVTLVKTVMDIKPVKTVGVLYNSREAGSVVQLKELRRIAAQQGFSVVDANVSTAAGLDAALNHLASRSDCIFVSESSVIGRALDKIMQKMGEAKIPVISQTPEAADKGALVTLEINPAEQGQLAGEYAAKILNGRRAGELPICTPKKIDLIINLRTARQLDLHVPFRVLNAATKVLK